jgi:hypothetical protein
MLKVTLFMDLAQEGIDSNYFLYNESLPKKPVFLVDFFM